MSKKVKREFSAGGAVYRKQDDEIKWLVILPKDWDRWTLPKGLIDEGESAEEAAVREVREEGGINVELKEQVKSIKAFFHWPPKDMLKSGQEQQRVFKIMTFYLMEYQGDREEGPDPVEVDAVEWLPYQQAMERLTFDNEKEVLSMAKNLLK